MLRKIIPALIALTLLGGRADGQNLGPAEMDDSLNKQVPHSVHDAWCQKLGNKCRVVFEGSSMKVEGYKGIHRNQLVTYRVDQDGGERYIYVHYKDSSGNERIALFLFANFRASNEFQRAMGRWWQQNPDPVPNLRYPFSQGPQDTHGR